MRLDISTAKFGSVSGVHKGVERVRHSAAVNWEVGTLFRERDGLYAVMASVPVTSVIGPRWDIYLRRASLDDQLAAEVMLT